jgi:hypothetical protein
MSAKEEGRYQMNRVITTIICTLACFVAANGATAEKHAVRVDIPFAFSASGAELPAGIYTITAENGFTVITKNSTRVSTFMRSIPLIDGLPDDSELVLSTHGDKHFLRKILCPGINMTLEILPSKLEIRAQAETVSNPGS